MSSLIPLDNLLGAFFLGVVLSSMLYGVTCLQVYSYFSQHCGNDKPILKYFVTGLLAFESLQMALLIHGYYVAGVTNFGDFVSDAKAPMTLQVQSLMGILVAWAIQQFYAWRIYQFSMGQPYIPSFIVLTSLTELAGGIIYFVDSVHNRYYQKMTDEIPVAVTILSLQVVCDLAITASMVYYLYTQCTRVKQTITMITTLALYSIISGALASVFSIACLIAFVRASRTLIYAPFFFSLVRVYICAFLATLNSRDRIRTRLASGTKSGVVINYSKVATGQNPGRDSIGTTIDIGPGTSYQSRVVPHFAQESRRGQV